MMKTRDKKPAPKDDKLSKGNKAIPVKTSSKRKRVEDDHVHDHVTAKRTSRGGNAKTKTRRLGSSVPPKPQKPIPTAKKQERKVSETVNEAPRQPLDVFVFGEGSGGELGLGSKIVEGLPLTDVSKPRLNTLLSSADVGVVQIACGGMHAVALTKDNKILTWGVNDLGALGRNTNVPEEDDDELNPAESHPGPIDTSGLDPSIVWVQVVAGDNASFALTEDGRVYGWGTFRSDEGIIGFSDKARIQATPVLVPDLKDIRRLAMGTNHVLALDGKGRVFAWGSGDQSQLARRVVAGHVKSALRPASIGRLPRRGAKAVKIACGSYHSFAIDEEGRVYGWGLNNYAELAIADGAGGDGAAVLKPSLIHALEDYNVVDIAGGEHHSLACTADGKLLTWGRMDGCQVGLRDEVFTEDNTIYDERGNPRILVDPTESPGKGEVYPIVCSKRLT